MKKILKIVFDLIILALLVIIIYCVETKKIPALGSICGAVLGAMLPWSLKLFIDLFDNANWKTSERKLKRAKEINKNTKIRISFAYLYRIIVDGKYMLIMNSRNSGRYQPVGGVYKFNNEEEQFLRNNFHIEYDDKISIDETSKKDYRLYIKDKYLRSFVKHFEKNTTNRENETNISREFIEEIINDYKIDKKQFGALRYSFKSRFISNVQYSSLYECYEILLADIYEFNLTNEQEQLLKELGNQKNIKFVTEAEINRLGIDCDNKKNKEIISNHSWKILASNYDKAYKIFDNVEFTVNIDEQ